MGNSTFISQAARHSRPTLFSGRLFPCGDFSFGAVPSPKPSSTDILYDRAAENHSTIHDPKLYYSGEGTVVAIDNPRYICPNPLISTLLPNSHSPDNPLSDTRLGRGNRGITSYGRRMLKSGVKMLEDKHGKGNLGFLTCTLPDADGGLSREDLFTIHFNWSEVIRQFLQALTRELARKGGDTQVACSSEIQEKRYRDTGIPALHIHAVYNAWDGKSLTKKGQYAWYLPVRKIRRFWQNAIANVLGREAETINCNASINVQRVKKSAVGYLGKYLSKGAKITKEVIEDGKADWLPKQWWNLYGGLRPAVLSSIIMLDSEDCLAILENRDAWQEGKVIHKFYPVEVEIQSRLRGIEGIERDIINDSWRSVGEARNIIIGYAGSFTPWGYVLFLGDIFERENATDRGGDASMQ